MTKKAEALLHDALDLDAAERAEVAAALLESLEPAANEDEIEQAWREEVTRRVAMLDSGQVELIPWEQVRNELLARLNDRR
jgi:putative addiction module component (TIGR02574 family)